MFATSPSSLEFVSYMPESGRGSMYKMHSSMCLYISLANTWSFDLVTWNHVASTFASSCRAFKSALYIVEPVPKSDFFCQWAPVAILHLVLVQFLVLWCSPSLHHDLLGLARSGHSCPWPWSVQHLSCNLHILFWHLHSHHCPAR